MPATGEIIHLATGIICGGPPTYCGVKLEKKYREETGKVHVLNATDNEDRATCVMCMRKWSEAMDKVESS